jgi:hypothetical protein
MNLQQKKPNPDAGGKSQFALEFRKPGFLKNRIARVAVTGLFFMLLPLATLPQDYSRPWSTFDLSTNLLSFPCLLVSWGDELEFTWSLSLALDPEKGAFVLADVRPLQGEAIECRYDFMTVTIVDDVITDVRISSSNTTLADDLNREFIFEINLVLDTSRFDNIYFLLEAVQLRNLQDNLPPEIDADGNLGDFPKQLNFEFELPASNVPDEVMIYLPAVGVDPDGDLVKMVVEDENGNVLLADASPGQALAVPVPQTQGVLTFTVVVFPVDEFGAKGAGLQSTFTVSVGGGGNTSATWNSFNWNEANWN